MTTPSKFVKQFMLGHQLVSEVTSAQPGWPCFIAAMPDTTNVPDDAVCVYDTLPHQDGRNSRDGQYANWPGIQIKVRSADYFAGYKKTQAILDKLDAVLPRTPAVITVDTTVVTLKSIYRISGILPIGQETGSSKRRFLFTLNFFLNLT